MFQRLRPTKVIKDMNADEDDEIVTSATFSVGKQYSDDFTEKFSALRHLHSIGHLHRLREVDQCRNGRRREQCAGAQFSGHFRAAGASLKVMHKIITLAQARDNPYLLTSSPYSTPLSTLWRVDDTLEPMHNFSDEQTVEFNNSATVEKIAATNGSRTRIYDLLSGQQIVELFDAACANEYKRNRAYFHPHEVYAFFVTINFREIYTGSSRAERRHPVGHSPGAARAQVRQAQRDFLWPFPSLRLGGDHQHGSGAFHHLKLS